MPRNGQGSSVSQTDGERKEYAGMGPTLPPGFTSGEDETSPPCSTPDLHARVIGPTLPPGVSQAAEEGEDEQAIIGPTIPHSFAAPRNSEFGDDDDSEEGEGVMGPTLPTSNSGGEELDYMRRLASFETKKATAASAPKREEWMTVLPEKMKKAFGLSAKSSFSRVSAGPDSSSTSGGGKNLWTATPNEKAAADRGPAKPKNEAGFEAARTVERDRIEQQKADQLNEGRSESLLELHQRKRKLDDPADEGSPGSRRPFNRDTDLGIRGFPSADTEETKKKLGTLCGRFAPSASKKFL